MRLLFCLIYMYMPFFSLSQRNGIKWTDNLSWKEVKEKAKSERKFIFVDCFTTWCSPCKKMDAEVFSNDSLKYFMEQRFICVKVQMDQTKDDKENLRKWYKDVKNLDSQYKILSYPTYLFFSPEGQIVHRAIGYKKVSEFITIASQALNPKDQYYSLIEEYKSGKLDYQLMPALLKTAKRLYEDSLYSRLAADYLSYLKRLPMSELYDKDKIEFIATSIRTSKSKFFKLFYPVNTKVNKVMAREYFCRTVIDSVVCREIIQPKLQNAFKSDNLDWEKLYKDIEKKYDKSFAERTVLWSKFRWYDSRNKEMSIKAFIELVRNNGIDTLYRPNDAWLNSVAWDIFNLVEDKSQINAAILWMEGVVRRNLLSHPFHYMDTYANLLYRSGRKEEAIDWEMKVVEIAKKNSDTNAVQKYQWYVNNMKVGNPTWPINKNKNK